MGKCGYRNGVTFNADEHRKKEVRITLVCEDIDKLKYVTTYIDECSRKDQFSFNRLVRQLRRKELPNDVIRYTQFCTLYGRLRVYMG